MAVKRNNPKNKFLKNEEIHYERDEGKDIEIIFDLLLILPN